jgi:ubiquinone/menaquinone biosynthesis C-methylase UbiE
MIRLARQRFAQAGLSNGHFELAAAEDLPFADGSFDQVVARLSFHHFQDASAALGEMRRVLRRGGRLAAADIVSVEDGERSALHNALEQLRDPSHVRFFPESVLLRLIEAAGFSIVQHESWAQRRSFAEWAAIVADPARTRPLETAMRALARAGQDGGIALSEESGELLFTHTWLMVTARLD